MRKRRPVLSEGAKGLPFRATAARRAGKAQTKGFARSRIWIVDYDFTLATKFSPTPSIFGKTVRPDEILPKPGIGSAPRGRRNSAAYRVSPQALLLSIRRQRFSSGPHFLAAFF